jgi:hypothetical protein
VLLDGERSEITQKYHRSSVLFSDHQDSEPQIEGTLSVEGEGLSWCFIHKTAIERFNSVVTDAGGKLVQSRAATLQEIFIARLGRHARSDESSS